MKTEQRHDLVKDIEVFGALFGIRRFSGLVRHHGGAVCRLQGDVSFYPEYRIPQLRGGHRLPEAGAGALRFDGFDPRGARPHRP